ncbi:MAG: hypothetical protein NT067_03285 [Candidatus Diapherotrites archaeon]|nr:hypothetical protein [Candidatus Diapherotrites archaeon]
MKRVMLRKLVTLGKIGGAHTSAFNLSKGLPGHIRSSKQGRKAIEQAIKELINERFLLAKPSTGELHISVNPHKLKEIKEFLGLGE